MDEIKNTEEMNEIELIEDCDATEVSGGHGKLVAGLALVGIAVLGGIAYKCKDKLTERQIKKLEKKGYVVYREDEVEIHEAEDEDESVDEA